MGVRFGGGTVKHAWSGADEDVLRAEWAATAHHGHAFNERLGKLLGRTAEGVRRKTIDMHLRPKRVVLWADPASLRREREPVAVLGPFRCINCGAASWPEWDRQLQAYRRRMWQNPIDNEIECWCGMRQVAR